MRDLRRAHAVDVLTRLVAALVLILATYWLAGLIASAIALAVILLLAAGGGAPPTYHDGRPAADPRDLAIRAGRLR